MEKMAKILGFLYHAKKLLNHKSLRISKWHLVVTNNKYLNGYTKGRRTKYKRWHWSTQFNCQAQKPSLLVGFGGGGWFQKCQPFFPSASGFVCTNFVKFLNFYYKCPKFMRFWWTLLSIIVIFYVEKHSIIPIYQHLQYIISLSRKTTIFEPPPPSLAPPPPTHTPGECSTSSCFLHFWVYF